MEAPASRRAGVEKETPLAPFHQWAMAVPEDDGARPGRRPCIFEFMDEVQAAARKIHLPACRQAESAQGRVVVAPNGVDGGDAAQPFEDGHAADIAGMEDSLDPIEGRQQPRVQVAMSVGDDADQHAASLGLTRTAEKLGRRRPGDKPHSTACRGANAIARFA